MSNTIGNSYGTLGTLIANSANVRRQLDTLVQQAGDGLVGDTYAALGSGAGVSLSLSPQIASLTASQTAVDQASGRLQVTQTALSQVQSIASSFAAQIPNLNGLNPSQVDNVAANARDALKQLAGLLNTKDGDVYVFAGQDTANPPVPSGDAILSSGFFTQIQSSVASLATNGAGATAAATLATAASNAAGTSVFSSFLSQPAGLIPTTTVQTGTGVAIQTGLVASANAEAVSTGSSTTGSYIRDLLRGLATLGSLSSSQVTDPNFSVLVKDTGDSLTGSVTALATDVGVLGNRQANLTSVKTQLADTATALSAQVSSVQDVDQAAVLAKLSSIQTQLQESYKLITTENSLSLMNYLPAG